MEAADYARKSSALPVQIDPVAIDRFTRLMREQLVSGDVAARKAYLASIVDAVIVSENKIRIMGSNDNIRSTFGPKGQPTPVVRKSVQEWCPGAGSNHRHCDFQPVYRMVRTLSCHNISSMKCLAWLIYLASNASSYDNVELPTTRVSGTPPVPQFAKRCAWPSDIDV